MSHVEPASFSPGEQYEIETSLDRDRVLSAIATTSEIWGARWERAGNGGRLELPVAAGLRLGTLTGSISIEPAPRGSRIRFLVDDARYRLRWAAVAIMVVGAAGGIAATLWPFYPQLLGIAPLAVVVALAAWILVASRLRTSTADEFLEFAVSLDGDSEGESGSPPVRLVEP